MQTTTGARVFFSFPHGVKIFSTFLFKVLVALIDTPFLYIGVYAFRKKFNLEINEEINID